MATKTAINFFMVKLLLHITPPDEPRGWLTGGNLSAAKFTTSQSPQSAPLALIGGA